MEERRDRKGNPHGKREGILEQKFNTKKRVQPIGKPHEKFPPIDERETISTARYREQIWTPDIKFWCRVSNRNIGHKRN